MKRPSWHPLAKWALLGSAISGIVMAMGSDEEPDQPSKGRAKMRQVAVAPRPADAIKHASSAEIAEFERLLRRRQQPDSNKEISNAFGSISWYVPPPPPPALPAPPPLQEATPAAPPLPFTYLGHFKNPDSPIPVIILGRADRVYTVSEGEVIDDTYRIGPVSAGMLEFTYLPLNVKQSLNTDVSS